MRRYVPNDLVTSDLLSVKTVDVPVAPLVIILLNSDLRTGSIEFNESYIYVR